MTLFLREEQVRSCIDMKTVFNAVEAAFSRAGRGECYVVPRSRVRLPRGTLHVLPAGSQELGVLGLKVYTSFRAGSRFLILLYSVEDGSLLGILEGDTIGTLRTGAASGVATKWLARSDADQMALFGAGSQAMAQIEAVMLARPIRQVRVFARNAERRNAFAERASNQLGVDVVPVETPESALRGADVVTTITTAASPLFPETLIQPGVHVNAAGSNSMARSELEGRLFRRAVVVVDDREQARVECGDLLLALERGWAQWSRLPELGEVMVGSRAGREAEDQVTVFESQGLGIQDLVVAAEVYRRAIAARIEAEEAPLS